MKFLYILIIALNFNFNVLSAQTVNVITGLDRPRWLHLVGNELFFTEYDVNDGKVSKIDVTEPDPVPVVLATDLQGPAGLRHSGDYLFIAEYNGWEITKVNYTSSSGITVGFVDEIVPIGLELIGNYMYFSSYNDGAISKSDITESDPFIEDVISGLGMPQGIQRIGNDLYIAEFDAGIISKINITEETPVAEIVVEGLYGPIDLELYDNDLYISEYLGNRISKIDISSETPVVETVAINVLNPVGLQIVGEELYIVEFDGNRISKIDLTPTSIDHVNYDMDHMELHPNPSSGLIFVKGLTSNVEYAILNKLGQVVGAGNTDNSENINIEYLSEGLYFLKLEEGNTLKFFKE